VVRALLIQRACDCFHHLIADGGFKRKITVIQRRCNQNIQYHVTHWPIHNQLGKAMEFHWLVQEVAMV